MKTTTRLANATLEICQYLYEANGSPAVYDYANKIGLDYHNCEPCEAETPTVESIEESVCAICGSGKQH